MKILVTGGSSGLGKAITEKCAEDANCFVYFTYYNSEKNARALEAKFTNTKAIRCDFKDEAEINKLKSQLGQMDLDVLINNAYPSDFLTTHFHKIPVHDFLISFQQTILPTINLTQAAINCFKKKKSGKIITILTSALLNHPPIGASAYIANKAYLQALAKVWATENKQYNIASNSISPSFMQTDFTKNIDERLVQQMVAKNPLKKLLIPDEVAEAVRFLCHASPHINGINLVVNSAENIY